jgi:hypothetical protein
MVWTTGESFVSPGTSHSELRFVAIWTRSSAPKNSAVGYSIRSTPPTVGRSSKCWPGGESSSGRSSGWTATAGCGTMTPSRRNRAGSGSTFKWLIRDPGVLGWLEMASESALLINTFRRRTSCRLLAPRSFRSCRQTNQRFRGLYGEGKKFFVPNSRRCASHRVWATR